MTELIKLTYKEFKELRFEQYIKQGRICPVLKRVIDYEDAVFDHKHKTRAELLGEDGKGLLRGVLHKQANTMEGKIVNLYKRYGLNKFIDLPTLLRNIAGYLENPPMKSEYVHPDEREFEKIGKQDFNRIVKYYFQIYPNRKKLPVYPKNGKINKELEALLEKANKLHFHKHKAKNTNSLKRKETK